MYPSKEKILDILREIAEEENIEMYLVGGPVRDLLMGKKNIDIDIAIKGPLEVIGEKIAERVNGKFIRYKKFLTGKIIKNGVVIDLAVLRKERYPKKAMLPVVSPAETIEEDLSRRDFTINAIALDLRSKKMVDPFKGKKDIENKLIRILHPESFEDDPTRILRAIRFKIRFGFNYEKNTLKKMKKAVKESFLKKVSMDRIFHELRLIAEEKKRIEMIREIQKFNIEKKILEKVTKIKWRYLKNLKGNDFFIFYLSHFKEKFTLKKEEKTCIKNLKRYFSTNVKEKLKFCKRKSTVYMLLKDYDMLSLKILSKAEPLPEVKEKIKWLYKKIDKIKPLLTGEDLKKMGIPPSSLYRKILLSIIKNMLDGKIKTKKQAMNFIRRFV